METAAVCMCAAMQTITALPMIGKLPFGLVKFRTMGSFSLSGAHLRRICHLLNRTVTQSELRPPTLWAWQFDALPRGNEE